jgi:ABC-type sugar transport system permease subunit
VEFRRPGSAWSVGRALAAIALVALVVGNLAFPTAFAVANRQAVLTASSQRSNDIVSASAIPGGGVLAGTNANRAELLEGGRVRATRAVQGTITDTAVAPGGAYLYVGTSLDRVYVFGPRLDLIRRITMANPVVGLATLPSGTLIVANGSGAFTDQYFLTALPAGGGAPTSSRRAAFTITSVSTLGSAALYGTINSNVGLVPQGGSGGWTRLVNQPVTAVLGIQARQEALIGDQQGGVTLLNARGGRIGTVAVSTSPISALAFDPAHGLFLVGTTSGELIVLDAGGQTVLERKAATEPIEAILPTSGGRLTVVPQEGPWSELDPAAVGSASLADGLVPWWIGFDIADLLLLAVGLLLYLERTRHRTVRLIREVRRGWLAYVLIAPAIVLVLLFSYYPATSAVYYSFTDFSLQSAPQWIGLTNYVQILTQDIYFHTGLINMVIITLSGFLKGITMPLLAAELVFWLRNRTHQYVFRTIFVLSAVVPGLVFTLMWKQVYDPYNGLIDEIVRAIGHPGWSRAWLGQENTAIWAVVGVGFPWISTFAFLVFMSGLLNINREYYDAASIDGAGRWSRFWRIDVPLLMPQFRIMTFFAVLGSIEGFASIFVLTDGGPGYATYVPALEMYLRISNGDLGYASALGVILVLIILALTAIVLRYRRQTVETG